MAVIIRPYEGVSIDGKDVDFGITQKQLKKILGEAPKIEIDNIMEEIRETRLGMVFTFIDKKLSDITASLHVDLLYNEIDIFNSDDTLSQLLAYDQNSSDIKGRYVNFYELGLSLGGFGTKKIPEKKLAIIFPKDRIKCYETYLKM